MWDDVQELPCCKEVESTTELVFISALAGCMKSNTQSWAGKVRGEGQQAERTKPQNPKEQKKMNSNHEVRN